MDYRQIFRLVLFCVLISSLGFIAVSAASYEPTDTTEYNETETAHPNLTFISTQGTENGFGGGVYAVEPETNELVWSSSGIGWAYDIDPVNDSTLLVSGRRHYRTEGWSWGAFLIDWRQNETLESVPMPPGTHDVDYLGNDRYLVAAKGSFHNESRVEDWMEIARGNGWLPQDRDSWHSRIYIINTSTNEITWEYDFTRHFPRSAGADYNGDWTHLNDVDSVRGGEAILASPRNFDRVVLIDRSTKELEWTLGEEDNHEVLYEQHNPALLSERPRTVLVADSENDRIVEYSYYNSSWRQEWTYGDTQWPRDADRLPNGNTLIVSTNDNRIVEVTPNGSAVWDYNVFGNRIGRKPYDVERLQYGDEPTGPITNTSLATSVEGDNVGLFDQWYALAAWVFPLWVGKTEFLVAHIALVGIIVWGGSESYWYFRD